MSNYQPEELISALESYDREYKVSDEEAQAFIDAVDTDDEFETAYSGSIVGRFDAWRSGRTFQLNLK